MNEYESNLNTCIKTNNHCKIRVISKLEQIPLYSLIDNIIKEYIEKYEKSNNIKLDFN